MEIIIWILGSAFVAYVMWVLMTSDGKNRKKGRGGKSGGWFGGGWDGGDGSDGGGGSD